MIARKHIAGFTLIELAIVVMIVGILVAITVPNYIKFSIRAKEAAVKENIHVVQSAVEVFAVDNEGTYPVPADAATIQGLLPNANYPANPFTQAPTNMGWNVDPPNPGEISMFNLPGGGYMLRGMGQKVLISPDVVVGN